MLYYERYEKARSILNELISKGNSSPDVFYWLGEIDMNQGKLESAKKSFQMGLDLMTNLHLSDEKFPLVGIGMASVKLNEGKMQEANPQMEKILASKKFKDPASLLAAAKANIESKNGDGAWAIELLQKAIKRDNKNSEIYLALGDAYSKMLDGSNAVINYNKALEVNPACAAAVYRKGMIYKSQKNLGVYLEMFNTAIKIDSTYAPALYELYNYYFYRNVSRAEELLNAYIRNTDPDPQHDYMRADIFYMSKNYQRSIAQAKLILQSEGENVKPRIFKLMAYSYASLGDSVAALDKINTYFKVQQNENLLSKDFALRARLIESNNEDKNASIECYRKAIELEDNGEDKLEYMNALANLQQRLGNRDREANWREKIYFAKKQPTNLDIYNWGIALYAAANYSKADSVFSIYEQKYPDQVYGYLYRAKCNALIDTSMELGLAIPHYEKLIEVASRDSLRNRSILLRALGYLGTYKANIKKDYSASLECFDRILEMDPSNEDAAKYAKILEKWIDESKESK